GAVPTWELEGHPELAALAPTIRAILERNHARYPGPNGAVEGYDAGPSYGDWNTPLLPDLIFARDLATILPLARFYAGDATLQSGVEEFLRLQYTDATSSADGDLGLPVGAGALSGTIAPSFAVDKATATSDEEPSVILAALVAYRAGGGAPWLLDEVDGLAVVDRLDLAMEWLLAHRLDERVGLIERGHTTDWGDLTMGASPQPTDVGPGDAWTYSVYDQAIGVAALEGLVEMNLAAGQDDRAAAYRERAAAIRAAADALLWQPQRGYYRLRL